VLLLRHVISPIASSHPPLPPPPPPPPLLFLFLSSFPSFSSSSSLLLLLTLRRSSLISLALRYKLVEGTSPFDEDAPNVEAVRRRRREEGMIG